MVQYPVGFTRETHGLDQELITAVADSTSNFPPSTLQLGAAPSSIVFLRSFPVENVRGLVLEERGSDRQIIVL